MISESYKSNIRRYNGFSFLWCYNIPFGVRKWLIWAIWGLFFLGILAKNGYSGEWVVVEKNYPAPFTGALLKLEYLQKFTQTLQKKEQLELENKILKNRILEVQRDCDRRVKEEKGIFWRTAGSFLVGVVISVVTVYALDRTIKLQGGRYENNRDNRISFAFHPVWLDNWP